MNKNLLMVSVCIAGLSGLAGCSGSGSSGAVTVEGDVPIAYVKRLNSVRMNPTDAGSATPGGDLYIRDKSSPSATEYNITGRVTAGQGDVSRPEVSYDGKKIVFAMHCAPQSPCSHDAAYPTVQDTTWSIWEYDFSQAKTLDQGDLRRVMSIADASKGDDYDPAYLPGGQGFVFTSNRQAKSSAKATSGASLGASLFPGQPGYTTLDEYEREDTANLHTMDARGANIQQISFNQSHDRSPTVLQNGKIMYSRWDHVGGRNHFSIFTVKPDGTGMFVLYGAHSAGTSRLHPREMQDGRVVTDLMPLSGTKEGGALMILDVQNYSEADTPAKNGVPQNGGQQQATTKPIDFNTRGISLNGRVTTPYPLWDGTNRVLYAFSPCQVTDTKTNRVVACADLTQAQLALLTDGKRLLVDSAKDEFQDTAPPAYSIQMFNLANQTVRTVVKADTQFIYKDPVALMARPEPNRLPTAIPTTPGPAIEIGTLDVRSVYDTDDKGRMGDPVLSAAERSINAIPKIAPTDPEDTRSLVADIAALKDPANRHYLTRPARFVRITRAVATPNSSMGLREVIGETDFEMQKILGYADVEPDGSFRIDVPADAPIAITVTDAEGRAFQAHTNWVQVRPGEQRTCDGCHSPRRGGALNSGALLPPANAYHPNTLLQTSAASQTMALTRNVRTLTPDIAFTDVWADTSKSNVKVMPCISLRYAGNTKCDASGKLSATPDPANDLKTAVPVPSPEDGSITINYLDHIQPLWDLKRTTSVGTYSCVDCHQSPDLKKLDLRSDKLTGITGTGRAASYQKLLVGAVQLGADGKPITRIEEGVQVAVLEAPRVDVSASQDEAVGLARKSRLMEILSGEELMADPNTRILYPTPVEKAATTSPTPNHATLLNKAEKRLLAEWIDLGGQYYNNPYVNGELRKINTLDAATFNTKIRDVLNRNCNTCHQAGLATDRFVLTGSDKGDFNNTLSMINNVCDPDNSYLLSRPSLRGGVHPSMLPATTPPTALLPVGSADYMTIRTWIGAGCKARIVPPLPTP